LRGIAFEYRATWESTLLGAKHVQALLGVVLGPAAALLGRAVPEVGPLRDPGSGDAAIWIHLFGLTAFLVVVVPRAALSLLEAWRARRFSSRIPLDLGERYYRRILAQGRGAARRLTVLPYSFGPEPEVLDRLRALLHDVFGARAAVRVGETLAYGADARQAFGAAAGGGPGESCHVVLFNLAQTPESDVHGAFLTDLMTLIEERGERLLVLVDPSGYRRRVPARERWIERLRAWERVVRDTGLAVVAFDRVDDETSDAVEAALWGGGDG
jgi:hypothetical protein